MGERSEQERGVISVVSHAMHDIDTVIADTVGAADQTRDNSQRLQRYGRELEDVVDELRRILGHHPVISARVAIPVEKRKRGHTTDPSSATSDQDEAA
ncbi:MAG: hypothetical protein V3V08_18470 [Nannocystaceae bacterium]